jgi:hypothetical protein
MKVRFKNGTGILMERKENALRSFPFGWHVEAGSRSWSCGAFLTVNDNQQGRTGSKRYECRKDLQGRVLFRIDRGPGILIYRFFKLRNGCRKKMMIRIWTTQRSPQTRPWFRGFAQSKNTDQEDYLHEDD